MEIFYQFPRGHRVHLRTTNAVGAPFATLRLPTDAAKRFERCYRATAMICKTLTEVQTRLPGLNELHLLAKVLAGIRFVGGVEQA
jgi:hypothetical protein